MTRLDVELTEHKRILIDIFRETQGNPSLSDAIRALIRTALEDDEPATHRLDS